MLRTCPISVNLPERYDHHCPFVNNCGSAVFIAVRIVPDGFVVFAVFAPCRLAWSSEASDSETIISSLDSSLRPRAEFADQLLCNSELFLHLGVVNVSQSSRFLC